MVWFVVAEKETEGQQVAPVSNQNSWFRASVYANVSGKNGKRSHGLITEKSAGYLESMIYLLLLSLNIVTS